MPSCFSFFLVIFGSAPLVFDLHEHMFCFNINKIWMLSHPAILIYNNNGNCAEKDYFGQYFVYWCEQSEINPKESWFQTAGKVSGWDRCLGQLRGLFPWNLKKCNLLSFLSKDTRVMLLLFSLTMLVRMKRQARLPLGALNKHGFWPLRELFQAKRRWMSRHR